MATGPRGPRKRGRPVKPHRTAPIAAAYDDDDDEDLRNSPQYKRQQMVIRIGTFILLFAFLSTSGITCIASSMSTPPPEEAAASGNQTQAEAVNSEIVRARADLKKDPQNTEAMGTLGLYLIERARAHPGEAAKKDMAEARQQFELILQKEPDNYRVWLFLGALHGQDNDLAKASEAFTKALELSMVPVDPKAPDKDAKQSQQDQAQVEAHVGLGEVNLQEKKYDDAVKQLDAALKIKPDTAKAYILRAKAQLERKQPEQARRDFQLALEVAKTLPQGSKEQFELFSQCAAGLEALDPKPKGTPTPGASATPVAAGTPVSTANSTIEIPIPEITASATPISVGNSTIPVPASPTSVNATP